MGLLAVAKRTRKPKATAPIEATRFDAEAARKALSGMYMSAFNMATVTDAPRAATAAMKSLARLNRLHFEPEARSAGVRVIEELSDDALDAAIDTLRAATGADGVNAPPLTGDAS